VVTNILVLVACFVIGGIPVGLLVARACGIPDIRKYGSGNIGASNVLRTVGVKAGLTVWIVDALKSGLPTWAAGFIVGAGGWWQGAAALRGAGDGVRPLLLPVPGVQRRARRGLEPRSDDRA